MAGLLSLILLESDSPINLSFRDELERCSERSGAVRENRLLGKVNSPVVRRSMPVTSPIFPADVRCRNNTVSHFLLKPRRKQGETGRLSLRVLTGCC